MQKLQSCVSGEWSGRGGTLSASVHDPQCAELRGPGHTSRQQNIGFGFVLRTEKQKQIIAVECDCVSDAPSSLKKA